LTLAVSLRPMPTPKPDTSRLYAWLARKQDGIEGIVSVPSPSGAITMVFTEREAAIRFRPEVQLASRASGFPARLVAFGRSHVLDEVYPVESNPAAQRAS